MKATKSLFLAFAGLGLFSCQNEDLANLSSDGLPVTKENSSVFVRMDFGSGSRGTGSGSTATSGSNKTTTVKNLALFFVDANDKIIRIEEETEFSQFVTGSGKEYTNVPGGVKYVYGVGNYKGKSDKGNSEKTLEQFVTEAKEGITSGLPKDIKDFENMSVHLSTIQKIDDALVYGADKDGLTSKGESDDSYKFEASFQLNHLVSRIEVQKIACTDLGTFYQELKLTYIGLTNFYMETPVAGKVSESKFFGLEQIGRPGTEPSGSTPVYSWGKTNDLYDWSWDAITNNGMGELIFSKDGTKEVTFTDNNLYVYQFVPSDVPSAQQNDIDFNLKLYLEAKELGDSNPVSAFSTVTGNFAQQSGFYTTPGKIYKVNFVFNEDNISGWNPDKENNVAVKVTVQDWEIVADVTPTYE